MKMSAIHPKPGCAPDWYGLMADCLRNTGKRLPSDSRSGELLARFTASARAIHDGFMRSFRPLGWTDHKFMVMVVLSAHDPAPATPSQLAHYAAITRASMSEVIEDLRRKGWIVRSRNPQGDRRTTLVNLTPKGREAIAEAASLYLTLASRTVRELPSDDLAAFERSCERLRLAGAALSSKAVQS
ncbi:MAG: MarR family transcriptional regulator [Candidatus Didemnitutus sp.]|nr:MarR family transcriptional regulator [Candidatus Didemnitutus sp.]